MASSRTSSTTSTRPAPTTETKTAAAPKREQKGGTILEDGRAVGYTREGALSATEGGPVDPTILPEEAPAPAPAPESTSGASTSSSSGS